MLVSLSIRNIVLIEALDLAFGPGLSILTGETGAGKSILLDAFALALGARGDGGLVRHGASQGQVVARFELAAHHPVFGKAEHLGLVLAEAGDAAVFDHPCDLILRRVQMEDGRTKAFVNDQPVSLQALRQLGCLLVEIHGQHDDRALMDVATHRALVDGFGGHMDGVEATRLAWKHWRALDSALGEARESLQKARREEDFLRHAAAELTALAPEVGEEEALAMRRVALMQGEKVAGDLREALEEIAGERAPYPRFAAALRQLERRRAQAPTLLEAPIAALDGALAALDQAQAALEAALDACQFEPSALEACEERLFALRAAARKYHCTADALPQKRAEFLAALEALDHDGTALAALEAHTRDALGAYHACAKALSLARANACAALEEAVMAELAPLKLERARFLVQRVSDETAISADGYDTLEFWVMTNPGTRPGPMMKTASGGELARFMLALKVALADRGSAPTLVFDEIDTGVGGAVADAIGERLARLASRVQVLAVTHAPQVAAKAGSHLRILKAESAPQQHGKAGQEALVPAAETKSEPKPTRGKRKSQARGEGEADAIFAPSMHGRLTTQVHVLHEEARLEEIARMLSGATITDEARAQASRLLRKEG